MSTPVENCKDLEAGKPQDEKYRELRYKFHVRDSLGLIKAPPTSDQFSV